MVLPNIINPLRANPTKWSNTLKHRLLPTNCLSVFDHFVSFALNELLARDHLFSTFAKFPEKLMPLSLPSPDTHTYVCVSGGKKC